MSKSVCGLVPATAVMTGMPAFLASASWASASIGLPMATIGPSTLAWIIASICSACLGRLPSELRIWTSQPFALAAAAAALATRACVSDDIWKAMMASLKACADEAKATRPIVRTAATKIFLTMNALPLLDAERRLLEARGRKRDRGHDDDPEHAAATDGEKARVPAADEGDAAGHRESEAVGHRRGGESGDQRGDLEPSDEDSVERPGGRSDGESGGDGKARRNAVMDEAADDDGGEAADIGEGEVELGGDEGEAEAETENGEEADLLEDVEQVGRVEEIGRSGGEDAKHRDGGERGAVGGDEARRVEARAHATISRAAERARR